MTLSQTSPDTLPTLWRSLEIYRADHLALCIHETTQTRKEMEDQLSFQQQLNILVLVVLQIEWKEEEEEEDPDHTIHFGP